MENEKEQKLERLKQDILFDYCKVKPTSALAMIVEEMGVDVGVKMTDMFQGKIVSFPTREALRRASMPMNIIRNLFGRKVNSAMFKKIVKKLSKIYGLPKRAIIEMNKTGKYTR